MDRIFLHSPGANDTFSGKDIPDDALEEAALFHFGYPPLMRRTWENDGEELTALFRRIKARGIATSLDLAAVDPRSGVLPYVDFFVPSFEELCWMLDRKRYDRLAAGGGDMTDGLDLEAEVLPLAEECPAMGCRAVLIKCGIQRHVAAARPAGKHSRDRAAAGTGYGGMERQDGTAALFQGGHCPQRGRRRGYQHCRFPGGGPQRAETGGLRSRWPRGRRLLRHDL